MSRYWSAQWSVSNVMGHLKGKHMEKFNVFISVIHQGRQDLMTLDLVFQNDGSPQAVLEWLCFEDGTSTPSVAVQLDPQ